MLSRKVQLFSGAIALILFLWLMTLNGLEIAAFGWVILLSWIFLTAIANAVDLLLTKEEPKKN